MGSTRKPINDVLPGWKPVDAGETLVPVTSFHWLLIIGFNVYFATGIHKTQSRHQLIHRLQERKESTIGIETSGEPVEKASDKE